MTVSLAGLDMPWLDPAKRGGGRKRYSHGHERGNPASRSDLPAPMLISDQIEVKSMVDGKTYTSKSGLRKSYREGGYIEVGNEEMKPPKRKSDRKGIRESVEKAFARTGIN